MDKRMVTWLKQREREGEYERIMRTHICAECHAPLTMPWDPDQNAIVLRCSRDKTHHGYVKPDLIKERLEGAKETSLKVAAEFGASPEELQEHAHSVDTEIKGILQYELEAEQKRRSKKMMEQELTPAQRTELAPYRGVISLTQEQATMILNTIWPDAPGGAVLRAALVCRVYGLNPLMKHVYLVPFGKGRDAKWEPILGIAATRLIAHRNTAYSYVDGPRIMSQTEQETLLGQYEEENIWAITVVQDNAGNKAPGYGKWSRSEEPYGTDKGNSKQNMAMIRSERNALNRLCPGEIPLDIEVMDDQFLSTPTVSVSERSTVQGTESPEAQPAIEDTKKPPEKLYINSIAALLKATHQYFGMTTEETLAALKVSSTTDIADVQEAWATIYAQKEG